MSTMSRYERESLSKLANQRARVAKKQVDQLAADRLADVESQLAAEYDFDDAVWADLTAAAKAVVEQADAEIAQRCEAMGVPKEFRPALNIVWYTRGENAAKDRRAELRRVAQAKIDAAGEAAKVEIDRRVLDAQLALVKDGLESAEAHAYLDALASIDDLIPRLELPSLLGAPVPPVEHQRRSVHSIEDRAARFERMKAMLDARVDAITKESQS